MITATVIASAIRLEVPDDQVEGMVQNFSQLWAFLSTHPQANERKLRLRRWLNSQDL